jgi:outer membrane protein TolC
LLERRLDAGYASATDVGTVRLRVAESHAGLAAARTEAELATGRLAEALAIPIDSLRRLELSCAELDSLPSAPAGPAAKRDALTNRLDVRARLLEFSAADASVRLEVARQYPTVSLRPCFLWDQGDDVWAIAADLFLPAKVTYGPAIAVAEAHREVSAQQALALQRAVIAEVDTRLAAYAQAAQGARAGMEASRSQLARSVQTQRQFEAGRADRRAPDARRLERSAPRPQVAQTLISFIVRQSIRTRVSWSRLRLR